MWGLVMACCEHGLARVSVGRGDAGMAQHCMAQFNLGRHQTSMVWDGLRPGCVIGCWKC